MPNPATEIPNNFFAPDREICLHAISIALLRIRSLPGVTVQKLAKALDCSIDTVRAATNEENLMSFDHIAVMCHLFPEQCAPVIDILTGKPTAKPTMCERVERIERELAALRDEAACREGVA